MKKQKRVIVAVCVFVGVVALVVAYRTLKPRPVEASSVEVRIDNFSFSPQSIVVRAGTQITWTNRDDIPHTVVEEGKMFKSAVLDTDEKFAFTPTKPGTYKYYCSIHPKMTAKLVVE
jgi:plastocyanin